MHMAISTLSSQQGKEERNMKRDSIVRGLIFAAAFAASVGVAFAQQRVLRHDESAPGRLDPSKALDYAASVLLMNVYDTLVEAKPGGGVMPALATAWTISDDGKTYTFTLRPDVKFHHGGTVTSEDVVFTLERTLVLNAGYARLFKGVSANAAEPLKVVFSLPEPNSSFLAALVRLPVIQKSVVMQNIKSGGPYGERGDFAEAFLAQTDAGSGAYRVTEHNPQEGSVLAKFPDYFGAFAANAPDLVRIRYGIEAATIRTLMSRREFEITSQWIPVEIKRALAGMPGMSIVGEGGAGYFILPINTRLPPTDDVNVRRAIAKAIDYDALMSLMEVTPDKPGAIPMHGAIPSGLVGHDKTIALNKRDVAGARADLAKSKYGANPPPLELIWVSDVPLEEKLGLLIQQNLIEVGIPTNLVKLPWTLLTQRATKAETTPNITQRFAYASYPDPDALISQNESRYMGTTLKMDWHEDAEFDRLTGAARLTTDEAKRRELYAQAQRRIVEAQPSIFAVETIISFARQDYVKAPRLEDPANGVAVQGGNWMFRTFSVSK
jgi:peptide/nickel transport system substrate-binding protein